jgi:tetratricopeptide (TPR) repeat protein
MRGHEYYMSEEEFKYRKENDTYLCDENLCYLCANYNKRSEKFCWDCDEGMRFESATRSLKEIYEMFKKMNTDLSKAKEMGVVLDNEKLQYILGTVNTLKWIIEPYGTEEELYEEFTIKSYNPRYDEYDPDEEEYDLSVKAMKMAKKEVLIKNLKNAKKAEILDAIEKITEMIEHDPNNVKLYYSKGLGYMFLKEFKNAVTIFDKSIEIDPNYPDLYYSRGESYFNLKEYDKALSDFNKTIKLNPNYAKAYSGRGNVYYRSKRFDEFISDINDYLRLNGNKDGDAEELRLLVRSLGYECKY